MTATTDRPPTAPPPDAGNARVPCPLCGEPLAFRVTEYPRTGICNDLPVSTFRAEYLSRVCDCHLTGWHDRFAERQLWNRLYGAAFRERR